MANSPRYTAKQASGYVFRFHLPHTGQSAPGELRFSLKTHDKLLASRRAFDVAMRIKEDIQTMKQGSKAATSQLTREQIRELVSAYVKDALDSIREHTVHRRPVNPDDHDSQVEGLGLYTSDLRESLSLNQLGSVKTEVDAILKRHGLSAPAELRQELAHAILGAKVDLTQTELTALRTGRVPAGRAKAARATSVDSTTFGEALDGYWKKQSKAWSKRTTTEYRTPQEGHRR